MYCKGYFDSMKEVLDCTKQEIDNLEIIVNKLKK